MLMRRQIMLITRHAVLLLCLTAITQLCHAEEPPPTTKADNPSAVWVDFNHYVRIARYDMADAAGKILLEQVTEQDLLDIVEASEYLDFEATFERAAGNPTIRKTANSLAEKIQAARISRSREIPRILADIERLGKGQRANRNATERLKAAGQYAAPHLLSALLDEDRTSLHPWVLAAIIELGRPMVYPLASALPHLEPAPMGQIAQGLAEIGYPESLPYLKDALESAPPDSRALAVVQAAYSQLATVAGLPDDLSAADLYLGLGNEQYNAGVIGDQLPGFDQATNQGIIWQYTKDTGLVPIPVPAAILPDALALRSARRSLHFDPDLDPALSLWLMANLRRENRLPDGEQDQSYPNEMRSPQFYMVMAGPLRQHDVLARALTDQDVDLALDAISALTDTAGTEALVNREGPVQPLIQALSYPRRSVRIAAAFSLAQARPNTAFPGSHRIVPVLAEAAVQSETAFAVVIADNQEAINALTATARELGYQSYAGKTLTDVAEQIRLGPGVDVFLTQGTAEQVDELYRLTAADFRLSAAPVVGLVSAGNKVELTRRFDQSTRLFLAEQGADADQIASLVSYGIRSNLDPVFSADRAIDVATTAMGLLREVAIDRGSVYNIRDAQASLIRALDDSRPLIVEMAAGVLAVVEGSEAQRAIADAALDTTRSVDLRVAILGSLAESSTHYGNLLTNDQVGGILKLVTDPDPDLAVAAATAHGALTLPTSNMVKILLD